MIKDVDERRAYGRFWYSENRQQRRAEIRQRRAEIVKWFKALKATFRCIKCGENHPACIEFHHRDPKQKELEISKCVANGWGQQRILAEIAKCDPLCSNCHKKEHWSE